MILTMRSQVRTNSSLDHKLEVTRPFPFYLFISVGISENVSIGCWNNMTLALHEYDPRTRGTSEK